MLQLRGTHISRTILSKSLRRTDSRATRQQQFQQQVLRRHQRRLAATSPWQQAEDPASGKTYFWNSQTRETSWELPAAPHSNSLPQPTEAPQTSSSGGAGATSDGVSSSSGGKEYAELLFVLREALSRDGSGMLFNETAGALRPDGVFSNEFFDHVSDLAAAAGAEEERLALQRIVARLSNPLLRQAPPYE